MFAAISRLEAGTPKELIDAAAVKFGMPMGPIELADTVGLDIGKHVAENLGFETPANSQFARLVSEGKLGKKTGEGFYVWVDGKPQKAPPEGKPDKATPEFDPAELDRLGKELVKPLIDECEKCLAEGVVADTDHVDAGVIFGTGFAPFRGGPMHYRNSFIKPAAPATEPPAATTAAAE
jgi:3-hydroxyacyl-CoA dehydrogenase/enoyl-CoA hydratase/3-hydroxybutyryl-CoA epimerase